MNEINKDWKVSKDFNLSTNLKCSDNVFKHMQLDKDEDDECNSEMNKIIVEFPNEIKKLLLVINNDFKKKLLN